MISGREEEVSKHLKMANDRLLKIFQMCDQSIDVDGSVLGPDKDIADRLIEAIVSINNIIKFIKE